MNAELSVVIPVKGNWWLTRRCLEGLERVRGISPVHFEVVVVDNASDDETPEEIVKFKDLHYIRFETNRNFAGGCNEGARAAASPLILFLNNDAVPVGDPLAPLVKAFEKEETVIAGGVLLFEDGAIQCAGLAVQDDAAWCLLRRSLDASFIEPNTSSIAPLGAAFAVRAAWFNANGGFDERYRNGYEETDLVMRAFEQKRGVETVNASRFLHFEGATAGRKAFEAENQRRFYERWAPVLAHMPRVARGRFGAFVAHDGSPDPLAAEAFATLCSAIRRYGHPVVKRILPWMPLDTRFRRARRVHLEWFAPECARDRSLRITNLPGELATIRVQGRLSTEVPLLPCVDPAARSVLVHEPKSERVALIGVSEAIASLLQQGGTPCVAIHPAHLLSGPRLDIALAITTELTDPCAFGNALLAMNGIPVLTSSDAVRRLFDVDTVAYEPRDLVAAAKALLANQAKRSELARNARTEAMRRFSPARSATRMIDLAFYACNGLESPARALQSVPDGVFERS
ncbi:MAG TPA: glycosyltransferase [Candidatus Aquilonibacter sp.]